MSGNGDSIKLNMSILTIHLLTEILKYNEDMIFDNKYAGGTTDGMIETPGDIIDINKAPETELSNPYLSNWKRNSLIVLSSLGFLNAIASLNTFDPKVCLAIPTVSSEMHNKLIDSIVRNNYLKPFFKEGIFDTTQNQSIICMDWEAATKSVEETRPKLELLEKNAAQLDLEFRQRVGEISVGFGAATASYFLNQGYYFLTTTKPETPENPELKTEIVSKNDPIISEIADTINTVNNKNSLLTPEFADLIQKRREELTLAQIKTQTPAPALAEEVKDMAKKADPTVWSLKSMAFSTLAYVGVGTAAVGTAGNAVDYFANTDLASFLSKSIGIGRTNELKELEKVYDLLAETSEVGKMLKLIVRKRNNMPSLIKVISNILNPTTNIVNIERSKDEMFSMSDISKQLGVNHSELPNWWIKSEGTGKKYMATFLSILLNIGNKIISTADKTLLYVSDDYKQLRNITDHIIIGSKVALTAFILWIVYKITAKIHISIYGTSEKEKKGGKSRRRRNKRTKNRKQNKRITKRLRSGRYTRR